MNLKFDDKNANRGTERGRELVRKSLQKYGAGRSILVDKNGKVIAGNKTLEQAIAEGIEIEMVKSDGKRLIVHQRTDLDLDKDQAARELAIADNRTSEIGLDWDFDLLAEMNEDFLNEFDFDPNTFFKSNGFEGNTDPDEVPEEVETRCKPGDLWQLGRHRLLCGDATNSDNVERLMDGKIASLFSTDPPYGVAYGVETGNDIKFKPILNDDNDGKKLQLFLENTFRSWLPFLNKNSAWYLWHAQMTQGFFAAAAAAAAAAVLIHRQIIWVKPSLIMGHGDFHWRHELCFYGWVQGNRARWFGDRKQDTVWEVGRENDNIHPTQKPVELFKRPMLYNTKKDEICAEPFAGSGTQYIAAEETLRTCYGMEIDPHYCDVILQRWENFTGQTAELIND